MPPAFRAGYLQLSRYRGYLHHDRQNDGAAIHQAQAERTGTQPPSGGHRYERQGYRRCDSARVTAPPTCMPYRLSLCAPGTFAPLMSKVKLSTLSWAAAHVHRSPAIGAMKRTLV